jgi:hypothetical protein
MLFRIPSGDNETMNKMKKDGHAALQQGHNALSILDVPENEGRYIVLYCKISVISPDIGDIRYFPYICAYNNTYICIYTYLYIKL